MIAVLGRFQRFDETDPRIDRPIDAAASLLHRVLQAELERVDIQLLGQFVDHRLAGESRLRGARRAIGRGLRLVQHDVVTVDACIGELIATEDAHAARTDHATGIRAGIVGQPRLAGRQAAVLLAPIFTRMNEPGVGPVPSKTSARDMIIFTGRPHLRLRMAATGSRYTEILPPKPPPISHGTTVTCDTGICSSSAVWARAVNEPCVDVQTVTCPS